MSLLSIDANLSLCRVRIAQSLVFCSMASDYPLISSNILFNITSIYTKQVERTTPST